MKIVALISAAVAGALVALLIGGAVASRVHQHEQLQRFLEWETCEVNHNPPTMCGPAPVP